MFRKSIIISILIFLLIFAGGVIWAEDTVDNEGLNRVAIRGYDKVDYDFTENIGYNYERPYRLFFMWDHEGDWVEWEIEVPESQNYAVVFMYAAGNDDTHRNFEVDGEVKIEEIEFPRTGGWGNIEGEFSNIVVKPEEGIYLEEGTRTIKMTHLSELGVNLGWIGLIPPEDLSFKEDVDVEDSPVVDGLCSDYIDNIEEEFELLNPAFYDEVDEDAWEGL